MLGITIYLILAFSVEFNSFRFFAIGEKSPCPYSAQNLSLIYHNCSVLTNVTSLTLNLEHGSSSSLEANLRDAFENYCRHIPDINSCVLDRLVTNSCERNISELYLTLTTKSNGFCSEDGGLKDSLVRLLKVSRPLDMVTIDRCKPSSFDFTLCHRFADMTRSEQINAATAEQAYDETDYLLDINLCVYSSVFVGCPADAAMLTILYEIEEWIPPRLDANTTEVLNALHNRARKFH